MSVAAAVAESPTGILGIFPPQYLRNGFITSPAGESNPHCQWHNGLCCYIDNDPERCPWCHSAWSVILPSDWHSCEVPNFWNKSERKWRVETAREMRAEADENGGWGTLGATLTKDSVEVAS